MKSKIEILEQLLLKIEKKPPIKELYINKGKNYCSIGYILKLCGIEDKTIKNLNSAHIDHPDKLIGISDIINNNQDDCKKEFHEDMNKLQEVLKTYNFNEDELEDLQYFNDKKSIEEIIELVKKMIIKEKQF